MQALPSSCPVGRELTMSDAKAWAKGHLNALVLAGTGLLFGVSALALATSLAGPGEQDANSVAQYTQELEVKLESAQSDLDEAHAELVSKLGTVDFNRVAKDQARGEQAVLQLADELDLEITLAPSGAATDGYRIASTDLQVTGVQSLNYSYTGLVELEPTDPESIKQPIFLLMSYQTDDQGKVSDLNAYQVSDETTQTLSADTDR